MDRRSALIQMGITTGGILAFTACWNKDREKISKAYSKLGISEAEVGFVRDLGEIIIPSDPQVKGSADLELEAFVLLMVNDCMKKDEQDIYMNGLRTFLKSTQEQHLKEKELGAAFVTAMTENDEVADDKSVKKFLSTTKQYVIQGFITSKYFMSDIMPYEMMPGKFNGKFPIPPDHKINIYG
jgi:hypothetical protein